MACHIFSSSNLSTYLSHKVPPHQHHQAKAAPQALFLQERGWKAATVGGVRGGASFHHSRRSAVVISVRADAKLPRTDPDLDQQAGLSVQSSSPPPPGLAEGIAVDLLPSDLLPVDSGNGSGSGGGDGNGGDGGSGDEGGSGDGKRDDGDGEGEEDEFGLLLDAEEVNRKLQTSGIQLPPDMAEAVRRSGIQSLILSRYLELQDAAWPLGPAIRGIPALRNRMLADKAFIFKVFTEVVIDSGCATFAEVQKRGKDFWNEFDLYMADLLVGIVVDVALVGMLAPVVKFGKAPIGTGLMSQLKQNVQALPNSVFEAGGLGRTFSTQQRVGTYFYKGVEYLIVGFSCGIIGQGIANSVMMLKRKFRKSEDETHVRVPPLFQSAALWGVFLAVSSNTRYQIINGLERVVEGSSAAKRLPVVAMAFTVGIRFANNIYGGMQFVDWARWAGVQ